MPKIELSLPRSWNQCSLPVLRAIADVLTDCSARIDRFHPFDMMEVKVGVLLRLTNIKVLEPINPRVPVEEQYYTCRLRPWTIDEEYSRWFRILRYYRSFCAWFRRTILGHDDTFSLYIWQINYWLTPHKDLATGRIIPGMLDWMNSDSKSFLQRFPFPSVKRHRSGGFFRRCARCFSSGVTFQGPNTFMDGFSWRRYRFAQDYMQMFIEQQNHFLELRQSGKVAANDILKATKAMDLSKALFLATIFNRKITFVNEETGQTITDYHYQSNQHSDNSPYFRNFDDKDWQLVCLWWQGMMHYLHQTYPKVFKVQKVKGSKKPVNPLLLYARTTATLEKYLHSTATDIEREPYSTILQQLEDITRRNEETEALNRKMRSQSRKK